MRRLALAVTVAALLGLAACSSDDSSSPTTTASTGSTTDGSTTTGSPTTTRFTEITGAIPPPTVTVPVVTQPVAGATTLPPVTPAPTGAPATPPPATTAPVAGCDGGTLFSVLGQFTSLPPGAGAEPPRCAGEWATMVVGAPGVDRALAVFFQRRDAWTVANFGNDAVCTGAAVPPELYSPLGCALWETG